MVHSYWDFFEMVIHIEIYGVIIQSYENVKYKQGSS
jgi:hypothetical protein